MNYYSEFITGQLGKTHFYTVCNICNKAREQYGHGVLFSRYHTCGCPMTTGHFAYPSYGEYYNYYNGGVLLYKGNDSNIYYPS